MKIKRTCAPDITQAIRKVREEQGPDAVILGNRKVKGGVEIISAIDYDEDVMYETLERNTASAPKTAALRSYSQVSSDVGTVASSAYKSKPKAKVHQLGNSSTKTRSKAIKNNHLAESVDTDDLEAEFALAQNLASKHNGQDEIQDVQREIKALRGLMENQLSVLEWNRLAKRHPTRIALLNRFHEMELGTGLAQTIADSITETKDLDKAWRLSLLQLTKKIPIADDDILNHGGIVALVGATGVGKTTTIAKLAARFAMKHGQHNVGLITTDTFRIGAQEQLLNFSRILGVHLHVARNRDELDRALTGMYDKKLVLIDTAGMSQRDLRLTEQFATLKDCSPVIRTYLVMSANTQRAALDETVRTFATADLAGCIVTKIDEAASLGGVISVSIRHKLPIVFVGTGQRVPEDLRPARAHRLVSRAVPLSQRYPEVSDDDAMALKYAGITTNAGY